MARVGTLKADVKSLLDFALQDLFNFIGGIYIKGLKEIFVGIGFLISGVLGVAIGDLEIALNAVGEYKHSFTYFIFVFFMIVGITYIIMGFMKKDCLEIRPLIKHDDSVVTHKSKSGLSNLITIDIISQSEYTELVDLYNKNAIDEQNNNAYIESLKTLDNLKSLNYFTDDEYNLRVVKLKQHFFIVN